MLHHSQSVPPISYALFELYRTNFDFSGTILGVILQALFKNCA